MRGKNHANIDAVTKALIHRYIREESDASNMDTDALVRLLRGLDGCPSTLSAAVQGAQPDGVPKPLDRAIIASVDDCARMIFSIADLEPEVEAHFRSVIPELACQIIASPDLPLQGPPTALTILDSLVEEMIGWAADLGRAGDKVLENTTRVLSKFKSGKVDIESLHQDLNDLVSRERSRILKLEDRLAASETGQLRSQQSRNMTAQMINEEMGGKLLTYNIASFLQGPWFDSVQLLVLNHGLDSEQWLRAVKLTETLVWTCQPSPPQDEQHRQKLYRIIENLPDELLDLLVALEHDAKAKESALDAIESDHLLVISGQELEYVEFALFECDEALTTRSKVSRRLQRKVDPLEPGQWFTIDRDGKVARIKLVLKLEDIKQLLFTNRNGMKVMQRSFDEFAYFLSSRVVKPLNHKAVFSSTFHTYYQGLIDEYEKFLRRVAEKRAEIDRDEQAREAARQKALAEAAALARAKDEAERARQEQARSSRLEEARLIASKSENAELVAMLTVRVQDLAIGAWLKLPGPDGQMEECKLAVKISASDKLIFVSRSGTKIGEYTSEQLVQLLVAGHGDIQDEGVEFEDTLAQVVSRLRQDRNKSYDDLTGK